MAFGSASRHLSKIVFLFFCLQLTVKVLAEENGWAIFTDNSGRCHLARSSGLNINEFLEGVIENFKDDMVTGVPELKIPVLDPFQAQKVIKVDVEEKKATFHGNFSNVHVRGLSGFMLEHLDANLVNLTLKFGLRVPFLRADGNYSMKGMVVKIVPLRGHGGFWIEFKNLSIAADASIIKIDTNRLQVSDDLDVDIDFESAKIELENFLGGGRWTEVILSIINNVSKGLFKKFLPLLKKELNQALMKVINKKLLKVSINIGGSSANEYVDEILVNVQNFIKKNNYDPMELPEYRSNFCKKVVFITVDGESRLYNGLLEGISTLHRTDNCTLESNKTTISISAHLGLNNLRISYKGHAKFMNFGPSIECGGHIKNVSFFFSVEQSNVKGSKPVLRDFQIVEMSTIWIELSGLGPLTWIMKYLLTGLSKLLESFIVEKVTAKLREYMEQEFQKVAFPF